LGAAVAERTESQNELEEGGMKSVDAVQMQTTTTAKEFLGSLTEYERDRLESIVTRPIEYDLFKFARPFSECQARRS
jgi:hypothetical protein